MRVHIFSYIFFCILVLPFSTFSINIYYTGKEKAALINTIETRNCVVSYVAINGIVYLLKQKKDPRKQLAAVRDALAAYIAECLGTAHQVDIIPFKHKFPGKPHSEWPATLHTNAALSTTSASSRLY